MIFRISWREWTKSPSWTLLITEGTPFSCGWHAAAPGWVRFRRRGPGRWRRPPRPQKAEDGWPGRFWRGRRSRWQGPTLTPPRAPIAGNGLEVLLYNLLVPNHPELLYGGLHLMESITITLFRGEVNNVLLIFGRALKQLVSFVSTKWIKIILQLLDLYYSERLFVSHSAVPGVQRPGVQRPRIQRPGVQRLRLSYLTRRAGSATWLGYSYKECRQ